MTLRKKLVALVVLVVLLVCAILAIASTLSIRSNLYGQLDQELRDASNRAVSRPVLDAILSNQESAGDLGPSGQTSNGSSGGIADPGQSNSGSDSIAPGGRIPAGQAAGTISVFYVQGYTVDAGYVNAAGDYTALNAEQLMALEDSVLFNQIAQIKVPGIGNVRAIAATNKHGDPVITGLSTQSADQTITRYVTFEASIILIAVAVAAGIGLLVVHRSLKPLDAVSEVAQRVSELPLDEGEVATIYGVPHELTNEATEVGKVGASLNRMLGHIHQALDARHKSETQVRQFVADASHELRTPLASIRGYSELVRRSPEDVPPGATNALARIESEAVRMSGLVEDLLLLAHLDSGREVATEEVDMSMLCIMTLSDAHAAGPDHTWKLEIPEEPCVIIGDEARLQQVLVNLLANARVHTPAGTAVTLSLHQNQDSSLIVRVHDNGPGIPENLRESLFQRFSRGDTSRNRNGGSTGLGLAIAHAIVTAHGGTITTRSVPGDTTMEVVLPYRPVPATTPVPAPPSAQ